MRHSPCQASCLGCRCSITNSGMTLLYHTPLSREVLRAQNVPDEWPIGIADRVHFGDLDALQHVNNAAYLKWLENIRIQYFMDWGITQYTEHDPRVVLKSLAIEYRKEMKLHEDYVLTARTSSFRNTSFTHDYGVFCGDLRVTARAVIVLLEPDGSAKRPLPEAVRQRFVEIDGAVAE